MCECYQIGGPFIAEDPDCPIHGTNGSIRTEEELHRQIAELQDRVYELERRLRERDR